MSMLLATGAEAVPLPPGIVCEVQVSSMVAETLVTDSANTAQVADMSTDAEVS